MCLIWARHFCLRTPAGRHQRKLSTSTLTPVRKAVLRRPGESAQYTSFAFTAHLLEAGIDASIGTVGDACDNALMESTIGLYKTELIKPRGPWRSLADVELATAEYVDWYNTRRLHTAIGGIPPAEHEAAYYGKNQPQPVAGSKP
jgi:transposase InsO family protein